MGPDVMILVFWILSFKPTFSLSSFTYIKTLFNSPLLSAIRVVSTAYLRLFVSFLEILISACDSSSPTFPMMYSEYKLNRQGDNIQPWRTPFPIWNQSVTPFAWQPTPVLLPGKSHGWRSLVGCNPWGHEESDMTERLDFHFLLSCIGEGNGNPLQCSCLENPRDRGAWWAAVYGVTQGQTRLKRLSSIAEFCFGFWTFAKLVWSCWYCVYRARVYVW